ncbi:hypothetical protein [Lentibacter sp.]|uniref:hypothetical protein n=1 Tax=Lentibacter sp. TaxID=2024994 RepID=UPI003F6C653E
MAALLCLLTLCVMLGVAWRANGQFQNHSSLPMQFGPTGQAGWHAPRRVALAFMPALAAGTLLLMVLFVPVLSSIATACACLLGGQLLYHWLLARSL